MGIFGADYHLGRLLAGVAVAHGRGEGGDDAHRLNRAYSAHSTLTSVHPYAAFDLSEDLEQAGAYRTGNGLAMAPVGARGALPEVGGFNTRASG